MHPPLVTERHGRAGLVLGLGAYLLWGFLPLYFGLLEPAEPVEIIAHRVVWSVILCVGLLAVTRALGTARAVLRSPRTVVVLAAAGALLAVNWLTYVYGVMSGHTVDAALGYYINPLVTVVMAVVVLGERLRRAQWVALSLGTVAVAVITVGVGRLPWIAVVLALSFGTYGLLKNRTGQSVGALAGLTVETAAMTPFALAYLAWLGAHGDSTFGGHGAWQAAALAALGVVTAVPLLLFAGAARRLPLSTIGLLQYLTPTLQFLIAIFVFHEEMPAARWWGFVLVWIALVVLTVDGLRANRSLPRVRSSDGAGPSDGDQSSSREVRNASSSAPEANASDGPEIESRISPPV